MGLHDQARPEGGQPHLRHGAVVQDLGADVHLGHRVLQAPHQQSGTSLSIAMDGRHVGLACFAMQIQNWIASILLKSGLLSMKGKLEMQRHLKIWSLVTHAAVV